MLHHSPTVREIREYEYAKHLFLYPHMFQNPGRLLD